MSETCAELFCGFTVFDCPLSVSKGTGLLFLRVNGLFRLDSSSGYSGLTKRLLEAIDRTDDNGGMSPSVLLTFMSN